MKKIIALLLVVVMCLSFVACGGSKYAPNGLEYQVNEDGKTCTIISIGKCTDTVVTVPEKIGRYTVTHIGKEAFCSYRSETNKICENIATFLLPSTLTTICDSAFLGCLSLTSIVIPDSVTTIESKAFQECTKLADITLSQNLTSIPVQMCAGCPMLTSIVIPDGVKKISGAAFMQSGLTQVTLGIAIEEIEDSAFESEISNPTFYYSGTLEQWKKIAFGHAVSNYEQSILKCKDAEISLQELYYGKQ